ncbi:MAG: hypothetical protein ACRDYU_01005 [Actinomycetes bacterium]
MAAIAWWLIPVVTTLLAIAWAGWMSRPKPPSKTLDSVETYERFRTTMEDHRRSKEEFRRAGRSG